MSVGATDTQSWVEGVMGAEDKVWPLVFGGGGREGCVEDRMLKAHERALVRRQC